MSGRLVVLAVLLSPNAAMAEGPDRMAQALMACRSIAEPADRLDCFDAIVVPSSDLSRQFDGFGTGSVPLLYAEAGTVVEYESGDAILLIDLLDARGEVLRNLHRAGSGTGRHVIERSDFYGMEVTATGNWRIVLNSP